MVDASRLPAGVRPITLDELDRLGISSDGRLYWDGRPVEVKQRLALTFWQKVMSAIVAVAAVVGGFGGAAQGIAVGHDWLCKTKWTARGCPSP